MAKLYYYECKVCRLHVVIEQEYRGTAVCQYCPNCNQSTIHNIKDNNMTKQTMTRKFYSTRSAIQRPQFLGLMTEAIEDAKRKLAEHPEHDEYYIVQIVKIVRREEPKPPINIIDVE